MDIADVKVLVVDDVNAVRVQVKELLNQLGFRKITTASNGEEAKKVIGSGGQDLILSDWRMEPGDGIDLLNWVRAHPSNSGACFIMVTAENKKEEVIRAVEAGVDAFVMKPLTPAQIESKVVKLLAGKGVIG